MKKITLVAISSFFLLTACDTAVKDSSASAFPTEDIKVEAREHAQYNYKGKTYLWSGSLAVVNDPEGKWVTPTFNVDELAASIIRKELANQGLNESPESADVVVAYGVGIDMAVLNLKSYADSKTKGLQEAAEGSLVIVLADKNTQDVLWIASAQAEYKKLAPDVAKKRIKFAIKEIFKRFPG